MATHFCRTDVDSIGFVHIFGSNAPGPYLSGFGNNPDDIYEDTKARVNLSILKILGRNGPVTYDLHSINGQIYLLCIPGMILR
jgi:hypothetical protein